MDESKAEEYVAPLVRYLETSTTLQLVMVMQKYRWANPSVESVADICEACFQNQSLRALAIEDCKIPARVFASSRFAVSLESLNVIFGDVQYTPPELQLIEDAFSGFPCLKKLLVSCSSTASVVSILSGLSRAKYKLNKLIMSGDGEDSEYGGTGTPLLWSTLSDFLHATTPLHCLRLDCVSLDAPTTSELILGLTPIGNSEAQTTMRELSLKSSGFDEELLVGFLKEGRDSSKSKSLDLLHISNDEPTFSADNLVSLLCPQTMDDDGLEFYPTIGSQIKSLVLDEEVPGFLPLLAENASLIGLTSLCLDRARFEDMGDLVQCISKVTSLRELKLGAFDEYPIAVLRALKANWNLHSVNVEKWSDRSCWKDPDSPPAEVFDSPLATAYCDRNQFLDQLLLGATRDEADAVAVAASHSASNDATTEHANASDTVAGTTIVPTLFQVANQLPSQRSTALIRSLTRLSESVGF